MRGVTWVDAHDLGTVLVQPPRKFKGTAVGHPRSATPLSST
jgi:hypothetical protein